MEKKPRKLSAEAHEFSIEKKLKHIREMTDRLKELHAFTIKNVDEEGRKALVEKQERILRYTDEYEDKYKAALLIEKSKRRMRNFYRNSNEENWMEKIEEAQDNIQDDFQELNAISANENKNLKKAYGEIREALMKLIEYNIISSTNAIIKNESPIYDYAEIANTSFSSIEIDYEELNESFDRFISESDITD
jgi:hypothetical protein